MSSALVITVLGLVLLTMASLLLQYRQNLGHALGQVKDLQDQIDKIKTGKREAPEGSLSVPGMEDIKQTDPELAEIIESKPAVPVRSVPEEILISKAAQDEIQSAPTAAAAVKVASEFIRNEEVAKVVAAVTRWRPRLCNSETDYQNSFIRHIRRGSYYTENQIEEKGRITWGHDQGGRRTAIPDLLLGNKDNDSDKRILVELKANLTVSGETDRAMGQMLRYLIAWKRRGPSMLIVCGDVSPEIRFLVRIYINAWRKILNLPVTVLFRRFPAGTETEMPLGETAIEATF